MEALLILFVVVRMLTNAAEDLHNAAKGRPRRPRLTDRLTAANGSGSSRYGARRYVGDLWQDAWSDARTSRDAKRAKRDADRAAAAQPDPAPAAPQPAPKPSPRPRPDPISTPDPAGEQPKLRLVPDPTTQTPDPATPPAGDNPTPAQPAGKDNPMSTTSGEITSVPAARSFAEAMLAHNSEVMGEMEHARASLSSRGISGPVIDELNSLREYYAQAGGRWEGLLKAIGQHERLAEQVRATQGAAKDTSFYTNA